MKYGIFTGAGVGPGDPELITIKALKAIESSDVLMLPARNKEKCKAYKIAHKACRSAGISIEDKICIFKPFPMKMDKTELERFHNETADEVAALLKEGKSVTFLTIGDPCIYSTFDYIAELIEKMGFVTVWISGITSYSAAAARIGISLGRDKEEIHIIPGGSDTESALKLPGTKIFMKPSSGNNTLKKILKENESKGKYSVRGVTECGLPNERIINRADDIPDEKGYMSVVIVKDIKEQ